MSLICFQFSTWHQSLVVLERKILCVTFYSSFKSFECLFLNVILTTILAFTFNVWNIEKLNGNNLKDEDGIFLTWEIYAIISRKLLPLEIEFEKNVLEGSTHEHDTFMKKDKLVFGSIFLNVVDSLLHHATYLRNAYETWDNLFTKHNMLVIVTIMST